MISLLIPKVKLSGPDTHIRPLVVLRYSHETLVIYWRWPKWVKR